MTTKIKIFSRGGFRFKNVGEDLPPRYNILQYKCQACGMWLDKYYSLIIHQLREAKLIDEDYPSMCCYCYSIYKRFGFLVCPKCGNYLTFVSQKKFVWDIDNKKLTFCQCTKCGEKYESKD